MNLKFLTRAAAMAAGLALAASVAGAAEPANPHIPLQKTIGQPQAQAPVPSLGVINSDGATLEGNTLTLTGVTRSVIIFADRPVRAAGHETTELFISRWGDGKDSFKKDPPNATVSVLGGDKDGVTDAVVVLKNPKLDGATLTFDVDVLEGDLKGLKGPAAVFIDWFAAGPRGFAVGGAGWHGGYHAWYGAPVAAGIAAGAVAGAAVGAAVAHPYGYYAPPACGYYPYPPCY
ncbi:MAG: hypothetical protein IOC82_03075 [Aestuariivirga sp.]|uniref:hypothetical protein n=1 Tax=Aestuariivirga sp. TaxID=2650926 RepID=UPI0025C6753B|nr:hypothetical protein [Aestuariivirga sp.]MCA3559998.1 hypothetical protein [Aestuariivirga sp.]